MTSTVLLTGATGYVGGQLLPQLLEAGHEVRCLVRDAARAQRTLPDEERVKICEGDVVSGEGLDAAAAGVDVAYYLVHSMGDGDFADRDRRAAEHFGTAMARNGVARTVYLGGLEGDGGEEGSEHLRSRHEVAHVLQEAIGDHGDLVHVRAAMIVGAQSASFQMLEGLVKHLPVMITPKWLETRSQPVAIADVTKTLAALAIRDDAPAEVQLGGADVLTYREMLRRFAAVEGRRQPVLIRVPLFTPRLSSYWVALVTPVKLGLVKPLVEGLSSETVVREEPPEGLNDAPLSFDDAVRSALAR
ncbi:nucleotide-sugar epimerase [Baekduia alba]|uniref:NAD(P)H-binding protein n=1 Tax=Baekduia alba TaxID=2997333 RepID=UPI0023427E4A|nr:NAD(P)H-binding protein [Baekduia alba]WCB92655.1 nucleotide-sugar epimerase [Baekduia alba]